MPSDVEGDQYTKFERVCAMAEETSDRNRITHMPRNLMAGWFLSNWKGQQARRHRLIPLDLLGLGDQADLADPPDLVIPLDLPGLVVLLVQPSH